MNIVFCSSVSLALGASGAPIVHFFPAGLGVGASSGIPAALPAPPTGFGFGVPPNNAGCGAAAGVVTTGLLALAFALSRSSFTSSRRDSGVLALSSCVR